MKKHFLMEDLNLINRCSGFFEFGQAASRVWLNAGYSFSYLFRLRVNKTNTYTGDFLDINGFKETDKGHKLILRDRDHVYHTLSSDRIYQLYFVDPDSYEKISLEDIASVIKDMRRRKLFNDDSKLITLTEESDGFIDEEISYYYYLSIVNGNGVDKDMRIDITNELSFMDCIRLIKNYRQKYLGD